MALFDCTLLLQPFVKAPKYLGCFYGLFTKKTVNKRKALHVVPSVGKDTNNKTIFSNNLQVYTEMLVIF